MNAKIHFIPEKHQLFRYQGQVSQYTYESVAVVTENHLYFLFSEPPKKIEKLMTTIESEGLSAIKHAYRWDQIVEVEYAASEKQIIITVAIDGKVKQYASFANHPGVLPKFLRALEAKSEHPVLTQTMSKWDQCSMPMAFIFICLLLSGLSYLILFTDDGGDETLHAKALLFMKILRTLGFTGITLLTTALLIIVGIWFHKQWRKVLYKEVLPFNERPITEK